MYSKVALKLVERETERRDLKKIIQFGFFFFVCLFFYTMYIENVLKSDNLSTNHYLVYLHKATFQYNNYFCLNTSLEQVFFFLLVFVCLDFFLTRPKAQTWGGYKRSEHEAQSSITHTNTHKHTDWFPLPKSQPFISVCQREWEGSRVNILCISQVCIRELLIAPTTNV